ncbi:MAG TPA: maltotransferase domain-containing protein, partial [Rhodanobacteraceae bacterium]|nr:maltotransferase domain-containing protein [Rhodanobacteraceae bacterium]
MAKTTTSKTTTATNTATTAAATPAAKQAARPGSGDGRARAVIDAVLPNVDCGRFAVKRVAGDRVRVRAHCFTDGHDVLRVMLLWREEDQPQMREVPMQPLGNDVWAAEFV